MNIRFITFSFYVFLSVFSYSASAQQLATGFSYNPLKMNIEPQVSGVSGDAKYFKIDNVRGNEYSLFARYKIPKRDTVKTALWFYLSAGVTNLYYDVIQTHYNEANMIDEKEKPGEISHLIGHDALPVKAGLEVQFNPYQTLSFTLGARSVMLINAFNGLNYEKEYPGVTSKFNVTSSPTIFFTELYLLFDYHLNRRHTISVGLSTTLKKKQLHSLEMVQVVYDEVYYYSHNPKMSYQGFTLAYSYQLFK